MDSSKEILEKYETIIRRLRKTWLAPFPPKKHPLTLVNFSYISETWKVQPEPPGKQYAEGVVLPCFKNTSESYQRSPKQSTPVMQKCVPFEPCDATNTFLKSMDQVYPGGILNVSKAALAMYKWKQTNKQTKLSQFSSCDHVYHGFYSCCSDTRVLVTEVIPYNFLDISDSYAFCILCDTFLQRAKIAK